MLGSTMTHGVVMTRCELAKVQPCKPQHEAKAPVLANATGSAGRKNFSSVSCAVLCLREHRVKFDGVVTARATRACWMLSVVDVESFKYAKRRICHDLSCMYIYVC